MSDDRQAGRRLGGLPVGVAVGVVAGGGFAPLAGERSAPGPSTIRKPRCADTLPEGQRRQAAAEQLYWRLRETDPQGARRYWREANVMIDDADSLEYVD